MNSLPLSNSYEVLRIDENDFAENENHDTTHSLNTLPPSPPPPPPPPLHENVWK